jgi:hypothetical protein
MQDNAWSVPSELITCGNWPITKSKTHTYHNLISFEEPLRLLHEETEKSSLQVAGPLAFSLDEYKHLLVPRLLLFISRHIDLLLQNCTLAWSCLWSSLAFSKQTFAVSHDLLPFQKKKAWNAPACLGSKRFRPLTLSAASMALSEIWTMFYAVQNRPPIIPCLRSPSSTETLLSIFDWPYFRRLETHTAVTQNLKMLPHGTLSIVSSLCSPR